MGEPKAVLLGIEEYREVEANLEETGDPEARKLLKEGVNGIISERTRSAAEIFGDTLIEG